MTFPVHPEFAAVALLCGAVGAVTDLRSRRIPNLLTGGAMLAGLALHLAAGGWREMCSSLGALVICGLVFLVFHLAGGMGAGDVKFIAAEGCLLGLGDVAPLLISTALAGGVLAVGMAGLHGRLRHTLVNVGELIAHHGQRGLQPHPSLHVRNPDTLRLPYGVAIAAGVAITIYLQITGSAPW